MGISFIFKIIIFIAAAVIGLKVVNKKRLEKKYNELNEQFEIRDITQE